MSTENNGEPPKASKRPKDVFRAVPKALRTFFLRLGGRSREGLERSGSSGVHIEQRAPAKVQLGNGDFIQMGLEVGPDGDTLEVQRRSFQSERAVVKIQAAFRRYKARALYQSLQALDRMNLELKWPDASPFIGLLIVRVNSITNLAGVRTAVLKAKFDGDVSSNVPGYKDKQHVINYDHRATFINIVVRSNSILTFDVMQSLEIAVRVLGRVNMPVSTFAQGVQEREEPIRSPTGDQVATMHLTVAYQWLRDTVDYGGYTGPEILVMPSRKMRFTGPADPIERLWKANHWLCSHDNVWCTSPDFAEIVRQAVRRERNKSMGFVVYGQDGEPVDMDVTPSTVHFQNAVGDADRPCLTSSELLQQITGTPSSEKLAPLLSETSISTVDSSFAYLGKEVLSALDIVDMSSRSDGTSSSVVEEECNYDYSTLPQDLIDTGTSDDTSSESSETEDNPKAPASAKSQPSTPTTSPPETPSKKASGSKCVVSQLTDMLKKKKSKRERPMVPCITGNFEYGVYRAARKRAVHIFARRVENSKDVAYSGLNTSYLGDFKTSKRGRLEHPVPRSIGCVPGHYNVMGMLPDDNTFGHGSLFLFEKGTKCVIFDLDGTITTSDVHVVAQTLLDSVSASTVIGASIGRSYDIRARPSALMCVRAWAAKGYQVIYLSGRQGSAYNMTLEWLIKHGYPPGPIHLTRTHLPTLPVYVSVGLFKIKYMEELKTKGLELYAAYGNTGTDIKAYENVGIPKERTFIVGPNGGKKNTQTLKDFTAHLPEVLAFPDSVKPIPYCELLNTSRVQNLT